jgi:hypothetical protein
VTLPQDEIITYHKPNIWGQHFRCSRRTAAWLDFCQEKLPDGHEQRIIQGCFNTGVLASAGTHDFDAVLDLYITGFSWKGMQLFYRRRGGFAWLREPPTFSYHIHAGILGYRIRVGVFVPGQRDDYLAHPPRNGLAGHALDLTPHPDPQFVFDYNKYIRGDYGGKPKPPPPPKGDFTMAEIRDLLQTKIHPDGTTVAQALRDSHAARADQTRAIEAEMRRDAAEKARDRVIARRIAAIREAVSDDASADSVTALRQKVLGELADLEAGLTEVQEAQAQPIEPAQPDPADDEPEPLP